MSRIEKSIFKSPPIINFIMLCSGLLLAYAGIPDVYFAPFSESTAQILGLTLKILGIDTTVINNRVTTAEFAVRIIPECTPVLCLLIYSAFIVAQQATITHKIQWILLGATVLIAVNSLRLLITFQISRYNPGLFHIVHMYFGQLLMSACVIVMCIAWSQYRDQIASKDSPVFFLLRVGLILSLLFMPWLYWQSAYMQILNEIVVFGFSSLGYKVGMNLRSGEIVQAAFGVIFFPSLILATRSLKKTDRIKCLLFGYLAISLVQITMNTCLLGNFLKPQLMWAVGYKIASITHYALPILMWVIAVYGGQLFRRTWLKS